MQLKFTALIAVVLAAFAITASAAPRLFGVDPFTNDNTCPGSFGLYEINPADASVVASTLITVPGRTITGANGLALDPTSGTAYAIVKAASVTGRLLITINLATGVGVEIGNLGANFSPLAFRPDGQLLGATGDGAAPSETLFFINKATAVTTLAFAMGNGADGEVIVYNPVDANLYHFSGNSTIVFEKWATSNVTYTPTNIPLSGASPGGEVFGAVWDPAQNAFLTSNISSQLRTITPAGVVSGSLGDLPNDLRGLILLLDQAITGFTPASPVVFGALPVTLSATGGASGNPVVFATTSLASVCTVSGGAVTFAGVGVCALTANQAAGGIYTAAPQVTASITITAAPQAITGFTPASPVVFGAPSATLTATGGASGSPVVFATTSLASVCTVSGSMVTFVGIGICNLTANQAAGANYTAAPQITASITITAAPQAITGFTPASPVVFGAPSATLAATGGASGSPVVFATTSPASVCTVSGSMVTFVGVGLCNLTANQAAGGNYAAAPQATASITIGIAGAAITRFSVPSVVTMGVAPITLSASGAPSGAPIIFATTSPASVCTVVGNTLQINGSGVCVITANQAAAGNFAASPQVTATVVIAMNSVPTLNVWLLLLLSGMTVVFGAWSRRRR
jgi:hypothetical protein